MSIIIIITIIILIIIINVSAADDLVNFADWRQTGH